MRSLWKNNYSLLKTEFLILKQQKKKKKKIKNYFC